MTLATIGSSDVPAILGLTPWSSPWKVWASLVGLTPRYSVSDDKEMAAGNMFEVAIGDRFGAERRCHMRRGPSIKDVPAVHESVEWAAARVDFWASFIYDDIGISIVEAKAPRIFTDEWGEAGTSQVPDMYAAQIAWQQYVTDTEMAYLAAFARISSEWRVYELPRNPRLEALIVEDVTRWHETHVIGGTPPDVDATGDCSRILALLHKSPSKVWVEGGDDCLVLAEEIATAKDHIEAAEKRKTYAENLLREQIGGAYGVQAKGRKVASWGPRKGATTLDKEALEAAHPGIVKQFEKTGEPGRTFKFLFQEEK